jgi:GWxTD domain-containing protein
MLNKIIRIGMKNLIAVRTFYILLALSLCIVSIDSCKMQEAAIDPKDLSYLYNPVKNPFNPRYNIYNRTDDASLLSVKFFPGDLYFSEANPQGLAQAMLLITVRLFDTSKGRVLADTAAYELNIPKDKGKQEYVYTLPLTVEPGKEYMTEVRIYDRIRLQSVQAFVPFNTLSINNKYNFMAQGHFEKNPLFSPIVRINEYVSLAYNRSHADSLYISYYKPFHEVPDPPSMMLPEKTLDYPPEKIVAVAYSDTLPLMFPREGIYLCSTSRKIQDGYTFLNMGISFPTMNRPEAMIEPLAYLATQDEMNDLRSSEKKKTALDNFWIKCGGNVEKARELIRIYYTRVLYANYYFSSYKEGWRSERGMIYIMYGPPDKVYKTSEGERWGYIQPVVKSSWGAGYTVTDDFLYFNFKKKDNVFSDNDFYLSRNETLVTHWDKAISSWRKGIVFRLDNPEGL